MSNTSTWPPPFVASAGVNSLNGEAGDITLAAGAGITISQPAGHTIQIDATGSSNILPGGSALSGAYLGDVVVQGAASLGADVTVKGDLFVDGDFTNTGGFALAVEGDCYVSGAFLFTPTSSATAQGNVAIGGDFFYGNTSEFKVNPGQAPTFTASGMVSSPGATFDGSGQPEASGLSITMGAVLFSAFNVSGGDSAGAADAGNGGTVTINGFSEAGINSDGGNSAFATYNAGSGGTITLLADSHATVTLRGGSVTVGNGNAGAGGTLNCAVIATSGQAGGPTIALFGGDAAGTGSGGAGGQIYCNGFEYATIDLHGGASALGAGGAGGYFPAGGGGLQNEFFTSVDLLADGGAGGTNGGDAGFCTTHGASTFNSLSLKGGAGTAGNGGAGGAYHSLGSVTFVGALHLDGGAGNAGSGTGGAGGNLTVDGTFTTNSTVSQAGGTGNTPGAVGTTAIGGNARANTWMTSNLGSANAPSVGFKDAAGNTNGMFFPSNIGLGFCAGNTEVGRFTASGHFTSAGYLAADGYTLSLDSSGDGNEDTALFPNATSDTILLTSSNNPDTTDAAGVKLYGKTTGTSSVTEFYNAGAKTGAISATGQWTLGAASTTPVHSLNSSTSAPASGVGTLTNMPGGVSGNPTGYITISINGVNRVIPFW